MDDYFIRFLIVQYQSEDDGSDSDYHPGGGRRRKAGGRNRGSRVWRK